VSGDEDGLSVLELRYDIVVVVREDTVEGGGEGLGEFLGEFVAGVTGVVGGVVGTALVYGGRGDVIGSAPDEDLVLSIFVHSLLLIKTLKTSIMPLIQLPSLVDRDPESLSLVHDIEESLDSTPQERGVGNLGLDSFGLDELSSLGNLLLSLGGKRTIVPSGELVLKIPGGLTVT